MTELLSIILRNSLAVSVAAMAALLLARALKGKLSARFRCAVWGVLAALLLVPYRPNVSLTAVSISAPDVPAAIERVANRLETAAANVAAPARAAINAPGALPNVQSPPAKYAAPVIPAYKLALSYAYDAAAYIWLAVAAALLAVRARRLFRFTHQARRWSRPAEPPHMEALASAAGGDRRLPALRVSKAVRTPVLLGLFRPVIMLPDKAYGAEELRMLLAHELTHYRHMDGWLGLLVNLSVIVNWFNPVARLLARRAARDIELACDEAVTRGFDVSAKKRYGAMLIGAASRQARALPVPALAGDAADLKRRLSAIFERRKRAAWAMVSVVLAVTMAAGAFSLVSCTAGAASFELPPAPETLAESDKLVIYAPGIAYVTSTDGVNFTQSPPWNELFNRAIERYKQLYPEVEVTYELIGGEVNGSPDAEYQQRLASELMAGEGPDVIYLNPGAFPDIYKAIDAGTFLDLTKIMENDAGYDPDGYYQNVMNGGVYRGRQFFVPLSFSAPVVLGNALELEKAGFDAAKAVDSAGLLNEAARALNETERSVFFNQVFMTPFNDNVYKRLFSAAGLSLYDYGTKTVFPREAETRRLLEAMANFYAASGGKVDWDAGDDWGYDYGRALSNGTFWADFAQNQMFSWYIASFSKDGAPNNTQLALAAPSGGLNALINEAAAIRASSPNRRNAYNFIKVLLSEHVQLGTLGTTTLKGTPVNRAAQQAIMKEALSIYTGVYGLGVCTKADIEQYLNALDSIESAAFDNMTASPAFALFKEKLEPYIKGEEPLDKCMREAKRVLAIYLSE